MIDKMDSAKPEASATLFRRVVEALFQSPLALGLQGDWLHYQAPHIFINLSVHQNSGKQRAWTVRAQLRTDEGQLLTGLVQSATLQSRNGTTPKQFQATIREGESSLVFREIIAGDYGLHVVMPDQEIVVRQISIGTDV